MIKPLLTQENQSLEPSQENLDSDEIVNIILDYKREAEQAFRDRRDMSMVNWKAYHSRQDFSAKLPGQSVEFLPKISFAVRQFANFVKRGLMGSSDWFEVTIKDSWLSATEITNLMLKLIEKLDFSSVVMESVKTGALSSLCILKVYMVKDADKSWFPMIEAVDAFYYYPDPKNRGLFEIHMTERDLYQIETLCNEGFYEKGAWEKLTTQQLPEVEKSEERKNQNVSTPTDRRKPVVISEFWGTLLNKEGGVLKEKCRVILGNEKVVLKKPQSNSFWGSKSPFIVSPLDVTPGSVWHKALFDEAVSLNLAINELFNLMLDSGMNAVHGVKTIRSGDIENPSQVAGGIEAGTTLQIKNEVPRGQKVFTYEKLGEVSPDAMAMFNLLDREFEEASMISSIKLGSLPQRQVKATEIIESEKNVSVLFDGVVFQIEKFSAEALLQIWSLVLQYIEYIDMKLLVDTFGVEKATKLAISSKEERKKVLGATKFRVKGVSAMTSKARTYQKLMALLQAASTNPLIGKTFQEEYSISKILTLLVKSLDINPDDIKNGEQEVLIKKILEGAIPTGNLDNKGFSHENIGDFNLASEINQNINPTGGFN